MLTRSVSRKDFLARENSGLTDEKVSHAFELNATLEFFVSENLPTHAFVPQVFPINGHRFCCRVDVDDAWREALLKFLCMLRGDGFFWVKYHQGKETVCGGS